MSGIRLKRFWAMDFGDWFIQIGSELACQQRPYWEVVAYVIGAPLVTFAFWRLHENIKHKGVLETIRQQAALDTARQQRAERDYEFRKFSQEANRLLDSVYHGIWLEHERDFCELNRRYGKLKQMAPADVVRIAEEIKDLLTNANDSGEDRRAVAKRFKKAVSRYENACRADGMLEPLRTGDDSYDGQRRHPKSSR